MTPKTVGPMPRLLWLMAAWRLLLGRVTDLVVTFGEVVVQRGGRKNLGAALRQVQCKM